VPINVGDAVYDPLFPYGWGLRTDGATNAVTTVQDQVVAGRAPSGWAARIAAIP
jgi:beta-glucosidase